MISRIRAARRIPPYDNAGWTLAYQMGVKFDRVLDGFDAPTKRIEGLAKPPAGTVANAQGAAGFLMSHEENDAVTVINRAFSKSNGDVYWLKSPLQANGKTYPAGTYFVSASALSRRSRSRRLISASTSSVLRRGRPTR